MGVDLHAHTTASDGTFSPEELVALAHERGLSAVAVTDHDTTAGWAGATAAGARLGVEIVPGIELSTAYSGGKFHLLAYYFDTDSRLMEQLAMVQRERAQRNDRILTRLADLGVPVELKDVQGMASADGQIGRPHLARALVERGYVRSIQEAFDKYLSDEGPAYSGKKGLTPQEAVGLVHEAGGVAIWAHPPRSVSKSRGVDLSTLEEVLVRDWIPYGLDGLEQWYSQYSVAEAAWASQMVSRYGILGAGGSDFHGTVKPGVELGITNTGGPVDDAVLTAIKARRDFHRSHR